MFIPNWRIPLNGSIDNQHLSPIKSDNLWVLFTMEEHEGEKQKDELWLGETKILFSSLNFT